MDDLDPRERAKRLTDALISRDQAAIQAALDAFAPERHAMVKAIEELQLKARAAVGNDNG